MTNKPQTGLEDLYPCVECGKLRTKEEGGTTFTVCDKCWDKKYKNKDNDLISRRELLEKLPSKFMISTGTMPSKGDGWNEAIDYIRKIIEES